MGKGTGLGRGSGKPRERWQLAAEASATRAVEEDRNRAAREVRLRPKLRESSAALEAWAATHATLLASLPKPTFMLWLHPLTCIGEAEDALCLSAPAHTQAWCERRYGSLIGELVRELSAFKGIYLLRAEELNEEDAPL